MRQIKFKKNNPYHLFNRGVDNRNVFVSQEDYDRFEAYLYLLNDTDSPRASNFFVGDRAETIFESARGDLLVALGAYSLLPTHFHMIATPLQEGGLSKFMQKISTAYTMYFNDKYQRSGALFEGTFKAHEPSSENHLKYLFAITHLAPARLFNKNWRDENILSLEALSGSLMDYRYSSISEYMSGKHVITDPENYPRYFGRARHIDTFLRYWEDNKDKYEFPISGRD